MAKAVRPVHANLVRRPETAVLLVQEMGMLAGVTFFDIRVSSGGAGHPIVPPLQTRPGRHAWPRWEAQGSVFGHIINYTLRYVLFI